MPTKARYLADLLNASATALWSKSKPTTYSAPVLNANLLKSPVLHPKSTSDFGLALFIKLLTMIFFSFFP